MPLKPLYPLLLCVFLIGCNGEKQASENQFEDLTQSKKDSLTDWYHKASMIFYQPSEIHRTYKDSALLINPDHVEYRQRLSYSYKKTGEHIKAMEILNEAVERDIEDGRTSALQYRAWSLLYFYRDYEGTIEDVDLINKMEPENNYTTCHGEPCANLKGQALYKLGKYEEAIQIFKDVIEVEKNKGWDPLDNFYAQFYMARCYSELENYPQATKIYKALIDSDKYMTEAYYQLGRIYNITGEKKKAQESLGDAKALLSDGFKFGEPYYEAFDEVFQYQIEDELKKTKM